jgi:hypothetical protein
MLSKRIIAVLLYDNLVYITVKRLNGGLYYEFCINHLIYLPKP